MGFSNQERINLNSKVLAASVIDANETTQWYESRNLNQFVVGGNKVWTEVEALRLYPAANVAAAQAAALAIPGIIEDRSANANAVRLTQVPGAAGTWIALATYNDFSSARLEDWIQPQFVPQSTGAASIGYTVELYNGQPGAGGVLINPTAGLTGSGSTASVGWIFNYANGLLLLSADFRSTITDPWIKGFRYIGDTAISGLVKPLPEEDGYVAIASGQNLIYLPGYDIGDALIWDGFTWVASRNTCGDYLIKDGYITTDGYEHVIDLFQPDLNKTYQVELRVQAESFDTGQSNQWSLNAAFQNSVGGLRQIGTTQAHLEVIENADWTVVFDTDGYSVQAVVQDGYYEDGYYVNWSLVGYYQDMSDIAVQGCGNVIIRGVQAVELVAGLQTTVLTVPTRVGACIFDTSDKRQVQWKSLIETTNVMHTAVLDLFDITNGQIIASVSSNSIFPEIKTVELDIPDDMPRLEAGIYEARLRLDSGGTPDSASCLYSALNDSSGSLPSESGVVTLSVPRSAQGVAGNYKVTVLAPTRIGGIAFSGAGLGSITFRAILQTTSAFVPATLELYDTTDASIIATLVSTSLDPEVRSQILFIPSDIALQERAYEIRLKMGAVGVVGDFVSCTYAAFEVDES